MSWELPKGLFGRDVLNAFPGREKGNAWLSVAFHVYTDKNKVFVRA